MAERTPNLSLPWALPSNDILSVYNETMRFVDAMFGANVIDRDLTSPPGGESTGDTYIVGASATGSWSGYDGYIAVYYFDEYKFYAPKEGYVVWVSDEGQFAYYDGSSWTLNFGSTLLDDLALTSGGTISWDSGDIVLTHSSGVLTGTGGDFAFGGGALATNATVGFFYAPTCAGTPTGAPTGVSGYVPVVVDTTNHKLYFYSGAAWRDAGP